MRALRRRVTAASILALAASCGGGTEAVELGGGSLHLIDLPEGVRVLEGAAGSPAGAAILGADEIWVRERVDRTSWAVVERDAPPRAWRARTRFPALGASGADLPDLEPGEVRVDPEGVVIAAAGGEEQPPKRLPIVYPASGRSVRAALAYRAGEDRLAPRELTLDRETRRALTLPLPGRLGFAIEEVPERARLRFAVALHDVRLSHERPGPREGPRGADFRLVVRDRAGEESLLFQREVGERGMGVDHYHGIEVGLAEWAGRSVELHFSCAFPDPSGAAPEWIGLASIAEPQLTSGSDTSLPNVLLVVIDTLRADRLGCYGWERAHTPSIDRLAREGVRFADAMSPSAWTLPSHASLFTSTYPSQHAVWSEQRLPEGLPTLAELLRDCGYSTAAITEGGFVRAVYGLARGFDVFNSGPGGVRDTVDAAIDWIEGAQRPFFAFVQTYCVHAPYDPPQEWRSKLVRPYSGELPASVRPSDNPWGRFGTGRPDERDLTYVQDLYDAEIAFADEQIGRLLERLEAEGLEESTLVVLTSDHGEEFFDHGQTGHGWSLYQEQLHVPLILRWGGAFEGGAVVRHPVHLLDVAPTLARAARAAAPAGWAGIPLSLEPSPGADRPLFAPMRQHFLPRMRGVPAAALREGNLKFVDFPEGGRPGDPQQGAALYDLAGDPAERESILEPADLERWTRKLEGLRARFGPRGEALSVEPADRTDLDALGYLGGEADDEQD